MTSGSEEEGVLIEHDTVMPESHIVTIAVSRLRSGMIG